MATIEASFPTPTQKLPVSQSKLVANRANALRSTGPRTSRGKSTSARNAIKHGLLAREVVNNDQGESLKDFQALLEDLCDDFQPVGRTEQMLVERIASCWWKLARAERAENAELSKELSAAAAHLVDKQDRFRVDLIRWSLMLATRELGRADVKVPLVERGLARDETIQRFKGTRDGIAYLKSMLQTIKAEVEKTGSLPKELEKLLHDCLGDDLIILVPSTQGPELTRLPEPDRKRFLAVIDRKLSNLAWLEEYVVTRDETEARSTMESASLPSRETMEKLLRYQAQIERQLYRALDQLEHQRRQRCGDRGHYPVRVT